MYLKYFVFLAFCIVIYSCEDMFQKEVRIGATDFPPKLSVTATLDTDSGCFRISVFEGRSLTYYRDWHSDSGITTRDGEIRLYENGESIFSLQGPFDLSFSGGFGHTARGVPARAGSSYRLEVDIDGYDMVTSTVIMPDAPIIGEAETDTSQIIYKTRASVFNRFGLVDVFSNTDIRLEYYATRFSLTDNSNEADYYAFQRMVYAHKPDDDDARYTENNEDKLGTSDFNLIQDNPEYYFNRDILSEEICDIYLFDQMVITDLTFAGSTIQMELLTDGPGKYYYFHDFLKHPLPDYDPEKDGRELIRKFTDVLLVKHISTETFMHYRSLVSQDVGGIGFFTEPTHIVTNVENGYGCFAAVNTQRITLYEYVRYYYPDRKMW